MHSWKKMLIELRHSEKELKELLIRANTKLAKINKRLINN